MPVTVIIGGQFGSEGKGKVAHFFARELRAHVAIRVGGPNSGHTVIDRFGNPIILKQLPTAALLPDVICVIGPGSYIDTNLLLEEIRRVNLPAERLLIDANAVIITDAELEKEKQSSLRENIGSTLSGTGAAVMARISRNSNIKFAKTEAKLQAFVNKTSPFLRECLNKGKRIIIEGTQGFGLSLLHSDDYPYVTSRDTSAAAFVSEVGLSPLDVDQIIMVIRAFPIRVSGNSGPLPEEITWQEITEESGNLTPIVEYTSVTKTVRRVAQFNPDVVIKTIMSNRPTHIVLNHVDYLDKSEINNIIINEKAEKFVRKVESQIGASIDYVGFGPASMVAHNTSLTKYKVS